MRKSFEFVALVADRWSLFRFEVRLKMSTSKTRPLRHRLCAGRRSGFSVKKRGKLSRWLLFVV